MLCFKYLLVSGVETLNVILLQIQKDRWFHLDCFQVLANHQAGVQISALKNVKVANVTTEKCYTGILLHRNNTTGNFYTPEK